MRKLKNRSHINKFKTGLTSLLFSSLSLSLLGCKAPDFISLGVMSPIGTDLGNLHRQTQRNSRILNSLTFNKIDFTTIKENARRVYPFYEPYIGLGFEKDEKTTYVTGIGYTYSRGRGGNDYLSILPFYSKTLTDAHLVTFFAERQSRHEFLEKLFPKQADPYFILGIEGHFADGTETTNFKFGPLTVFKHEHHVDQQGLTGYVGLGIQFPLLGNIEGFVEGKMHETIYSSDIGHDPDGFRAYGGVKIPIPWD